MGIIFNREHQKRVRQGLRTHGTRAEALLWLHLKGRQMEGFKFRRQHGVREYIVDFYCPELSLAIEVDGISHDSVSRRERDVRRQREIESFGVKFLRVRDEDVNANLEAVVERIRSEVRRLRDGA